MTIPRVDTLIFGGGVAGLWTLHELLAAGVDAWLVELAGLGGAQSMQAQGIVHGGGKYALRRVGDVEAIRQIREMPERWRDYQSGRRTPSLASARLSSNECWLWLPARSWRARFEALTLVPMLRHGGVLASPPRSRERESWPLPLQQHALRAYSMDEPVFEPVSVIESLAAPVADRLLQVPPVVNITREDTGTRIQFEGGAGIVARQIVACAGAGNAGLLESAGHDPARMQRRPLRMGLIRGDLPALHGHCVLGGRTRMTITSIERPGAPPGASMVWQLGGELAERWAETTDAAFFPALLDELNRVLPGMDVSGMEIADYAAVRAEAANDAMRRPSGVQVESVADDFIVAWPTKWAMAPLLAEEIARMIVPRAATVDGVRPADWPRAPVAQPPWEQAEWRSVNSVRPA